jgi:hypothetical protein
MAGFFGNFQQLRISKRGKNGEKQKKKGKGETKLMCVRTFLIRYASNLLCAPSDGLSSE